MARGTGTTTPKKVTEGGLYSGLAKSWHIHQCSNRDCRLTYECTGLNEFKVTDCSTRENARCQACRGRERQIWITARDPRPCCVGNQRQVLDRSELLSNRLAGSSPWYRCRTCARPTGWPQGQPTTPSTTTSEGAPA